MLTMRILGTAQIRKKGEVTFPKKLRDAIGFKTGDKIAIVHEEGKIVIKRIKTNYSDIEVAEQDPGTK